jgi:hypothetical protein
MDGFSGQQCEDIIFLGVSRELVAQDEDFIIFDLGHLHNLLLEDIPDDVMQTLLIFGVRDHSQHFLRWLLLLDNHNSHILKHIMVRVVEFLQELRQSIR